MDGTFIAPKTHPEFPGHMSMVTYQLYLNEGFEGGTTRFFGRRKHDVIPKTGANPHLFPSYPSNPKTIKFFFPFPFIYINLLISRSINIYIYIYIYIHIFNFKGSVLLFEHALTHSGELLVEGVKYCLRTDVMYHKSDEISGES